MVPGIDSSELVGGYRTAAVAEREGSPIGVCIFLAPEDLEALGIDPGEMDSVAYHLPETPNRLAIHDDVDDLDDE